MNAAALKKANRAVDTWNARHAVGTPVEYTSYPGAEPLRTRTRSIAWVLGGHTPVVMIEQMAGGVALDHLELLEQEPVAGDGLASAA